MYITQINIIIMSDLPNGVSSANVAGAAIRIRNNLALLIKSGHVEPTGRRPKSFKPAVLEREAQAMESFPADKTVR